MASVGLASGGTKRGRVTILEEVLFSGEDDTIFATFQAEKLPRKS